MVLWIRGILCLRLVPLGFLQRFLFPRVALYQCLRLPLTLLLKILKLALNGD